MPTQLRAKTWRCFSLQGIGGKTRNSSFVWAARQLHEDNYCVLFIYVGLKPVVVGTWRCSGITHGSESWSCWCYSSVGHLVLSVPCQHQQGTDKPANEFKMAFKIEALAEDYLQEANKMMECVMWWNDCFVWTRSCKRLCRDIEQREGRMGSNQMKWSKGHLSQALGYFIGVLLGFRKAE